MSHESTLYSVLNADATLTGYVSDRIYPARVPEEAPAPFISYHQISSGAFNTVGDRPCAERKEFEIGCVSSSFDDALAIAERVKDVLELDYGHLTDQGVEYYDETQEFRVWLHWSLIL